MNRWLWGLVVLIVIAWGIYYWTKNKDAEPHDVVRIGAVLGLTGEAAVDALNVQRGIKLAQTDLKKQGVNVNIVYEDDGTNSSKTVSAVQKILSVDKPQAFVGFTWDFNLDAVAPILNEKKMVGYSPTNTIETATSRSSFIFYGSVPNEKKLDVIASYLREHHIKRVAIIVSQTAWGDNHVDIFTRAAEKAGATVVGVERVQYGAENDTIPTLISKFVQNKMGALLITHSDEGAAVTLKILQERNIDIPVIGTIDVQNAVTKGLIKKTVKADWLAFINPGNQEFRKKFKEAYGEEPGVYAENAYDGLMVIVEAIRSTDGSSERIAEYLHSGKTRYRGYTTSTFVFNAEGALEGGSWILQPVQ